MKPPVLLIALPIAAYLLLSHWVLAAPQQHVTLGMLLALAPPAMALALFFLASGRRWLVLPLLAAVGLAVWQAEAWVGTHFSVLYFLQDVGTPLFLALMFGRSLQAGQQPLCSQMAAFIHGGLDEELARYTRQVTVAWTLFFLTVCAVSTLLYLLAPLAVWSMFSNLMVLPLTGLMFVVEYAIRLRRLPQRRAEMRFTDTFRAYRALKRPTGQDAGSH